MGFDLVVFVQGRLRNRRAYLPWPYFGKPRQRNAAFDPGAD
ncbi:hypothetical protein CG017_05936 (plasmid) [Burkholderia glumae]|nr:hypothetical protein CG017_05936 [Burkholderia glumae]